MALAISGDDLVRSVGSVRNPTPRARPFPRGGSVTLGVQVLVALAGPAFGRTIEFRNGHWFDGNGFAARTVYVDGPALRFDRPARIDSIVDLEGHFVVPPFGEAHNHNVESSRADRVIARYLAEGIFYVKNPNSLPRFTTPLRDKINHPQSIDVSFAGGGITGAGGHPIAIAKRMIDRGVWGEADGEGGFYFTFDSSEELQRRWPEFLSTKPDFIKTYLLYSEEYEIRRADSAYVDWRGLDPTLLPEIVRRAHDAGLRVSTHVETAADFGHAVAAGVDEINHLPGFRPDGKRDISTYAIADADARRAGENGVIVVTTAGALIESIEAAAEDKQAKPQRSLLAGNLTRLHQNGVRIAIGSDRYEQTSRGEFLALGRLGVFDNATLLRMWCETTAAAIFPGRKIGRLDDGYEASFLVLERDPLQDLTAVETILLRIKQGVILPAAGAAGE